MSVGTTGVMEVLFFATITAEATGLGAIPFLFVKSMTRRWLGISNASASGLMLAASFGLVYEGVQSGVFQTVAGALLGLGAIVLAHHLL